MRINISENKFFTKILVKLPCWLQSFSNYLLQNLSQHSSIIFKFRDSLSRVFQRSLRYP